MASTSIDILHNSPALHALKRDQLLSLCRVHGVRASGKNADIVRRLQQHAQTMNYNNDEDQDMAIERALNPAVPRVSEQWEVVMDTIDESDERSQKGTITSLRTVGAGNAGEFGTGNSKGMGSLKAFASSWGFRRGDSSKMATTVSSTASSQVSGGNSTLGATIRTHSTALTTPDISPRHMSVDDDDPMASPLPGTSLRPGAPVPSTTARLSMGTGAGGPGPSTTIRLIASSAPVAPSSIYASPPKLKALTPSFDLDLDTSMASPSRVWPQPSQSANNAKHYPTLPVSDGDDDDMPGAFETNTSIMKIDANLPSPPKVMPEPFVFGSPHPRHSLSNAGFAAAANDIYTEMNRRLAAQGAAPLAIPLPDMLSRGKAALANGGMPESPTSAHPSPEKDRFAQAHQREFEKMESIADVVARRQGANAAVTGRKRKSSVAPAPNANVAPVQRRAVIPGGFFADDDDQDDDEPQNRRLSKRPRVSIREPAPKEDESEEEDPREASARLAKEREAIQRKLAASRARRRSSRVSGAHARPRVSIAKPAPKSRFGFLSSAKTLVKSVWNRGAAVPAPASKPAAPPVKPAPAPEPKKLTKPAPAAPRPTAALPVRARPSIANTSGATSRPEPRKSIAPTVSSAANGSTSSKATCTSRKSFAPGAPSARLQVNPPAGTTHKRVSSIASNSSRPGHARTGSNDSTSTVTSTTAKRTSTLYAPTAASLARQASIASRPLPTPPVPSASSKASVIARNAPTSAHGVLSPSRTANARLPAAPTERPTIFGRPFAPAASPTKIPSPVRPAGENTPAGEPSVVPSPVPKGMSTIAPRKVLNRPRISRSKVLAKVNAQREAAMATPKAASDSGVSTLAPKPISSGRKSAGRVRSSLGAGPAARRSLGAIKAGPRGSSGGPGAVDAVAAAAKRRARQSEYTRRKSTVAARTPGRAADA